MNLKYLLTTMPLNLYSKGYFWRNVPEQARTDLLFSTYRLLIRQWVGIQSEKLEMFKEKPNYKYPGLATMYQQHQELNARNIQVNK
jgi:hypothetical protein